MPNPTPTLTINERVATELRAAAARRSLSGAALARRCGLPTLYVQRRLSGNAVADLQDLVDLCAGLDMHVLDLVAQVLVDADVLDRDEAPH